MNEDWKKYPVGSVGYYKSMQAYKTPEHLREGYKEPVRSTSDMYKFKKAIRVVSTKLK